MPPRQPFSVPWVEQLIRNRLGDRVDNAGVAVTDLASGQRASVNGDRVFLAASVAKIATAMAVLHLVTEGRLSLDTEIEYDAETHYQGGAGTLQFTLEDGDMVPVSVLLDRMIIVSDNIARNMLEQYVGWGTIQQYVEELGVTSTVTPPERILTANETNLLLELLDSGRAGISPELTQFLVHLMASAFFRQRIPAKLPPEAVAATKVGTLIGYVHDAGYVYAPDRSFIISVFTEGIPEPEADTLIADLAAAMYWYQDWRVRAG